MKKLFFLLCAFVIFNSGTRAQVSPSPAAGTVRHKMAVFTPLYLDDAFGADGSYRFSNKSFPRNSIQGLEFYHGVSMAIDSLNALNLPLEVYIYDSKSGSETLEQQFDRCAANGVELILANSSINEIGKMAKLAADKKITLINATVPNDGNTSNNPYFVLVNSTLGTQVEGIYHYVKKNYPGKTLTFFTRQGGNSENFIKSVFETLNKQNGSNGVPVKYVEISDTAAITKAITAMDKTQPGLFFSGSLDNGFGTSLLTRVASLSKSFPKVTVIGMPTWENIGLSKTEYKGVEVIYSTPFYNPRTDAASKNISSSYNKKMFARPSDLVFRGFGLTYRFGRMLNHFGKNLNNNLNNRDYRVFIDYDFQPVYEGGKLKYYENKKLYFLKYFDGALQGVD